VIQHLGFEPALPLGPDLPPLLLDANEPLVVVRVAKEARLAAGGLRVSGRPEVVDGNRRASLG